jgi:hypothetical protein
MRSLVAIGVVAACGSGGGDPFAADASGPPPDAYVDFAGPLFDPEHLVEISIELAPADWAELRGQTRTFASVLEGDCLGGPRPTPFTTYPGAITIDGTRLDNVGIKKKGFFGSLHPTRPSLKIKIDEYDPDKHYLGLERLTLNNSNQDDSYLRTCLAYQAFTAAGIVAPRCNFARVTVNGELLGIYVDVESIDKRMIKKRYANGNGNLYEGSLSDFRTEWVNTFEPKGGGDRADIQPIVTTLETATDGALVDALDADLDVDQFRTYWAMEMIVNHWDGYSNNKNNFFIYNDPTAGRFQFIPWGPDATYQIGPTMGGLGVVNGPIAAAADGLLANRLFAIPGERTRFLDRQRELLTTVWNESALLAEVARMEALIAPVAEPLDGPGWRAAVDGVRDFITGRRTVLTAALDAGPTWTKPLAGYPCLTVIATLDGTFATTFGTTGAANPLGTGSGTLALTIGGTTTTLTPVGATSGYEQNPPPGQQPSAMIQVFGRRGSDGHIFVLTAATAPARFYPRVADLGFFDAFGLVHDFDPANGSATLVGLALGTLELDQAATTADAPISGSFHANADAQATAPPRLAAAIAGRDLASIATTIRARAAAELRAGFAPASR